MNSKYNKAKGNKKNNKIIFVAQHQIPLKNQKPNQIFHKTKQNNH
jgi:hypothetical protein